MNRSELRSRAERRCWATEGVLGGDRSCPKLAAYAHCRECSVLVVAAHQLLSRLPAEEADTTPPHVSSAEQHGGAAQTDAPARPFSVITFDVGGASLALEATRVVEVATERPVRRVPHRTGAALLGLVNVQGRLEPCFSLAAVLKLPPNQEQGGRRLIVVGDDSRRCAFYAHHVSLREADMARVGDPPATVSAALDTHVRAILRLAERPWSWLDADRLMLSLERALS